MAIPFMKMSGAGNDFVVIDNRDGQVDATPEFNNVYDLLGETWWTNPKTPFSALVKWGVRPILGAGDHESPDEAS